MNYLEISNVLNKMNNTIEAAKIKLIVRVAINDVVFDKKEQK